MFKNFSIRYLIISGFITLLVISTLYFKKNNYKNFKVNSNKKDNVLNVYVWGEVPKFNPMQVDSMPIWWLTELVWEGLLNIDNYRLWSKGMAISWKFNKSYTQLELKLRPDVKWSNGRLLSQRDFDFSFRIYEDSDLKSAMYKPILSRVGKINFKDNKLILYLDVNKRSDPYFATRLYWSEILNTFRLFPYDFKENQYLGTGPYKVKKFSSTKTWFLEKNKNSWFINSYPRLKIPKQLVIKPIKSEAILAKVLKYKTGLIMGKDLFSYNLGWSAILPKKYITSLFLNINQITLQERIDLITKILSINDTEKLNLPFKNFNSFKSYDEAWSYLDNNKLNEDFKNNLKKSSKLKKFSLKVLLVNEDYNKWLLYLKEKLKHLGIDLELNLVTFDKYNEAILKNEFISYVNVTSPENYYPYHMLYYSNGALNFMGIKDKALDQNLDRLVYESNEENIKKWVNNIHTLLAQKYYEVPIFSYESSMLWTRKPCKPIQKQFQGLGLIYKSLICADN